MVLLEFCLNHDQFIYFFIHLMQFISVLCLFLLRHQRRLWRVFAFKQFGTVFPPRNSYCIYVSVFLVYALYLYWSSLCFFSVFQWFCCTIASVFALITNVYSYQTSILGQVCVLVICFSQIVNMNMNNSEAFLLSFIKVKATIIFPSLFC